MFGTVQNGLLVASYYPKLKICVTKFWLQDVGMKTSTKFSLLHGLHYLKNLYHSKSFLNYFHDSLFQIVDTVKTKFCCPFCGFLKYTVAIFGFSLRFPYCVIPSLMSMLNTLIAENILRTALLVQLPSLVTRMVIKLL